MFSAVVSQCVAKNNLTVVQSNEKARGKRCCSKTDISLIFIFARDKALHVPNVLQLVLLHLFIDRVLNSARTEALENHPNAVKTAARQQEVFGGPV